MDEEHDASFKQQESFRYNARDISVYRAKQYDIPVILGSATPSLESLHNAYEKKYVYLTLPQRAGISKPPKIRVIDMRRQESEEGLSKTMRDQIHQHLIENGQILLFLNRRGFAPVLICHRCGWTAACHGCDAHMTIHANHQCLRCHHCGAQQRLPEFCPNCGSPDLTAMGEGTERVEQTLRRHFTNTSIIRIDRDTTRHRGEIQTKLQKIHRGEHQILIGTQLLSKGHDFPNVTLVGIINIDQGLYGTDFRATERMAQLIVQVAGRAGRADRPGTVLIQTHQPQHPLLTTLLSGGYGAFGKAALMERRTAELPPYCYMAVLRAEATDQDSPLSFLAAMKTVVYKKNEHGWCVIGPAPAPMERRAGRYRAHLLATAKKRSILNKLLEVWDTKVASIPERRKVRWSLDVDPIDLY